MQGHLECFQNYRFKDAYPLHPLGKIDVVSVVPTLSQGVGRSNHPNVLLLDRIFKVKHTYNVVNPILLAMIVHVEAQKN